MNGETGLHQSASRIPRLQLLILMGGAFIAFLDTSIVNVAIPRLMSIFGVGIDSSLGGYLLSHSLTANSYTRPLALSALEGMIANQATAGAIDYTMIYSAIIVLAILPVVFFLRQPKTAPPAPDGEGPTAPGAR